MGTSNASNHFPGSLWESSLSYITRSATINDHKHYCYKVAVSLDHSINCMISQAAHVAIRGFIVNQKKRHQCAAPEGPVLNNLIEPESIWGKRIRELLGEKDFVRFEDIVDLSEVSPVLPPDYQSLSNEKLVAYIEKLMASITGTGTEGSQRVDERIERVVGYVSKNLSHKISNAEIVDLTFLSFERTRHLFAEQMGIPLSRYILWQRLRRTLKEVVSGAESLSKVSRKYGFTDLSHFNRTFNRIFGFNPSTFLLEARVII